MKLIDLLVKELPKRGGWPYKAKESIEMHSDGDIFFDGDRAPDGFNLPQCDDGWRPGWGLSYSNEVTKEQYESALAASEGWIEWGGGECPIDETVRVDLKYRDGRSQSGKGLAQDWRWWHGGNCSDIIAYRLHKPDINSRANDGLLEQDLNECIGASEAQVWNGEGVPPIGCACEMQDSKGAWLPVEIIAKNDGFTFGWSYDYRLVFFGDKADEFRQLRTEAEKARYTAIESLFEILDAGVSTSQDAIDVYDAIAAGKIPGVKLENK